MVAVSPRGRDVWASSFQRPGRARDLAAGWPPALVRAVGSCAAPDLAVETLAQLEDASEGLVQRLHDEPAWLTAVLAVTGASDALARQLANNPEQVQLLRPPVVPMSSARLRARFEARRDGDAVRRLYRRELLVVAGNDLTAVDPLAAVPQVARRLSSLADATVAAMLRLAIADVAPDSDDIRLGVVAMGKCGGQELNYVSDVDVIFVAADDASPRELALCERAAGTMMRLCSATTPAGTIWPVDAALRPEGNAGPLVRTLSAMRTYYAEWAKPWEFQALLKARPMAGDLELAEQFCELVAPRVWRVGDQPGFVTQVQAMRRRVVSLLPRKEATREIKLGEGGLRDIEFTVQLLQLVHGRTDERLRQRGTLPALKALVQHGYVGRTEGAQLASAWAVERLLEHRSQLMRLRRTHLLPDDDATRMRMDKDLSEVIGGGVAEVWKSVSREVGELHRRIFYSPLLGAIAAIPSAEVALSTESVNARLTSVGFVDPAAATGHIRALTGGSSRRSAIQRQLMPALLSWLGDTPNPDAGMVAFRRLSEEIGSSPWYLRALRDEGAMAPRLARVLGMSRYVVDLFLKDSATVAMLADPDLLSLRPTDDLDAELEAVTGRAADPSRAVAAVRSVRRRELLRIALGEILGHLDPLDVGRGLSNLVTSCLDAAWQVCRAEAGAPDVGFIAMGRWGGAELGHGSDVDLMLVCADDSDVASVTAAVARMRELLGTPGPEPRLMVDADLRPEGRHGPLVRSAASYAAYYERWSSAWESQALLRARPGGGAVELCDDVLAGVASLRWPEGGPSERDVVEMRRLKVRMETERTRGADPRRHTKLGPGALSDVEWIVQLLQLRHAHEHPTLRGTGTLDTLEAARQLGLVSDEDTATLTEAWLLATRSRNATVLVRGRIGDVLPTDARELSAVARLLGFTDGEASGFLDTYRRTMRRSRDVHERLFLGLGDAPGT